MSFPSSPVNNQEVQVNGIIYIWNSAKGAWRRKPGVSTGNMDDDLIFNGNIIANSGARSISTTTGAIQVTRNGGIGVTGNVNAGAFYSNNYFYANGQPIIVQTASTANSSGNIAGGAPGQLVYQQAANVTSFLPTADYGKILAANGLGNAPVWVNLQELAVLQGAPFIAQIVYPDSQTAAADAGGETIYVLGSGFKPGFNISINAAPVASATYITSSNVSFITEPETIGSYTLTLTNPNRQSATYDFIEFAGAGVPRFLNPAGYLNFVQQTLGFNQYILVTGGYPPYNFQLTRGNLPSGMTIDNGTGLISGYAPEVENPTSFNFTVQVTDTHNQTITRDFYILVTKPIILSNELPLGSLGSAYEKGYIVTANTWANTQTISLSSLGSAYEKGYIVTANIWANTQTISLSSLGSAYEKGYIVTANTWANTQTISLSSLGSAYEQGYILTANTWANVYTMPLSSAQSINVTNNALMILDASNTDSYPGTGTTWYDISGYNNNATLGGTPQLLGTSDDKYFDLSGINNLLVPDVVTINLPANNSTTANSWTYIIVGDLSSGNIRSNYNHWAKTVNGGNTADYFYQVGGGGNGPTIVNGSSAWVSGANTAMWYGQFSGSWTNLNNTTGPATITANTYQGNTTRYATDVGTFSSINPAFPIVSGYTDGGSNVKLILLYNTINAPTLSQAYSALQGRFGI